MCPMRIIVAPDSFKECLPSPQVAASLGAGARARWPEAEVVELPLADGGEGTLDILAKALQATPMTAVVHDPLGRPVQARYAISDHTAIIEVAQAVGLSLLAPEERNPLKASSTGLGELLLAAYENGCRHYLIGMGGTATCDGGAGMLSVPGILQLQDALFELLCDVDAPFLGPKGAARVFAPQKGASPEDVEVLEDRMRKQAAKLLVQTGVDVSCLPGAGAAGGLAGALVAAFGAEIEKGIDRILDLVRFQEWADGADLIITGEGKSDAQTLMGKVPMGVLQNAGTAPVALLSGRIEDRTRLQEAGFNPIVEVSPRSLSLAQAMTPTVAADNLYQSFFSRQFSISL